MWTIILFITTNGPRKFVLGSPGISQIAIEYVTWSISTDITCLQYVMLIYVESQSNSNKLCDCAPVVTVELKDRSHSPCTHSHDHFCGHFSGFAGQAQVFITKSLCYLSCF